METVKLERRQGPRKAQYYTLTTSTEIEHTTTLPRARSIVLTGHGWEIFLKTPPFTLTCRTLRLVFVDHMQVHRTSSSNCFRVHA